MADLGASGRLSSRGLGRRFAAGLQESLRRWPQTLVAGVYGVSGYGPQALRCGHVLDRGDLLREEAALPAPWTASTSCWWLCAWILGCAWIQHSALIFMRRTWLFRRSIAEGWQWW